MATWADSSATWADPTVTWTGEGGTETSSGRRTNFTAWYDRQQLTDWDEVVAFAEGRTEDPFYV
jgi:hypothetical protein